MHCFGEVFLESRTDFNKPGYDDRDEKVKWMRDAYPKAFLERCVFGAYTEDIDGVGFKIFPSQIQGRPELIGALNALRNVKIIHLSRKNYLESYVSLKMAQSTGNYGIKDPSKRSTKTLILDPKETEQAFTKLDDDYSWGKKFFSSSPSIEIDYQDLVLSRSETLAKVLSFIGVAKEELVTDKVKQEVRPMHEVIMNYAELKAYFSKTKWSGFFQDE
jgi:LPS sulfotransferase NodH